MTLPVQSSRLTAISTSKHSLHGNRLYEDKLHGVWSFFGRLALEDTSNYPDSRLRSYYIVLQSAVQRITDPFDESMLYIALAADHQTHDDPLTITVKS